MSTSISEWGAAPRSALRLFVTPDETTVDGRSLTLRACFEKYLLPEIRSARAKATLTTYRAALKHWEQRTGNPPVKDIRRRDFVALRDSMLGDLFSPATFNKQLRCLLPMLRRVTSDGWDDETISPLLIVMPRVEKLKTAEKLPVELSRKELSSLYRSVKVCRIYSPASLGTSDRQKIWQAFLVMVTLYGGRTNELRLMKWEQIDFDKRRICIRQTKTGKVPDLWLHKVMLWHLQTIETLTRPSGRVFGFTRGTHAHARFYDDWHSIRSAAGFPALEIRDLRETCASIYHGYSNAAEYVLGHRQSSVTTRHYVSARRLTDRAIKRFPVPQAFRESLPSD